MFDGSGASAPRFLDTGSEGTSWGVDPFEAGVPIPPFLSFLAFFALSGRFSPASKQSIGRS